MKPASRKRTPNIVNLTVKRRYLTEREVERLMDCARKHGRYGHRDATMILVVYRHRRLWGSRAVACAALASRHRGCTLGNVFVSERGGPISPIGFHRLIQRVGEAAKMPFPIHPHMLRHACGFKLANDGHDTRALQHYLGHKNIQHTVRYTEMAPDRFKNFWR
jgi:site-specific recombinase XerC